MDLSDLFSDHDVSEPACMDKIYMYVDELRSQDEDFMKCLIDKLHLMDISWERPWYQTTRCLTRPLKETREGRESYRTDRFSQDEIDSIRKNWKKFRKEFDVPDTPSRLAKYKSETTGRRPQTPPELVRHFVISYLARGLNRTLHQVYRQFLATYTFIQSGTYSPLEEKVIQICLEHCPPDKAARLLKYILGRDHRQLYNKINKHFNGKVPKKYSDLSPWTLERASLLLNLLLKETGLKLPDLKYKQIDREVWLKVEEQMRHPMEYIKNFWYRKLHVQVFVQQDLKLYKIRMKVFKRLRTYPYKVWNDIRWKEFVKEFPDGCTPLFIYHVAVGVLIKFSQYRKLPLEEVIEYALERIPHKTLKLRLKRLTLNKNGKLEPVKKDSK